MARIVAKLILVQFPCPTMCSVSPRPGSSRAAFWSGRRNRHSPIRRSPRRSRARWN